MIDLMAELKAARQAVWDEEPAQVRDLLDPSKGYTDTWDSTFFPTLYAWLETVSSRNVFYVLRKILVEQDLDLETAKRVVAGLVAMYVPFITWANLPDTAALFQRAAGAVADLESKAQLAELLHELVLYTGRLNYRIEPFMPWPQLIQTFSAATLPPAGSA